ncbi:MAG: sigma-54 dependent transcriptional regulator [Planctomycetota bacterium]|nr:sigma-54 dependent transcriptional regulator [Planctomycetota bacterium]
MSRALVVDDNRSDRLIVKQVRSTLNYQTIEAENGEQGLELTRQQEFDLIFLDFIMPGLHGIEALQKLKEARPRVPVVLITVKKEAEGAIEAMRYGAYDYLSKPVDPETLRTIASQAIQASQRMKVPVIFEPAEDIGGRECIIGRSPLMWEIYKGVGRAAATGATVLITGESGTGKELVARAIYQHSTRAEQEFVTINCAAVPENLLESELFGHEKGSFTGAQQRHIGKFERANGGTILLDEIGEMGAMLQAKLLRVIQEKQFERVGGNEVVTIDTRIIAATNRDLKEASESGEFREDLYFRLDVVHIHLPPLRERREDIPELCEYLLKQVAREVEKPIAVLSAESMKMLLDYEWPGNIRELKNVLARATVAAPTEIIQPHHLSLDSGIVREPTGFFPFTKSDLDQIESDLYKEVVGEVEKRLFEYTLARTSNNQVQAAKLMGISRNMLRNRMGQVGHTNQDEEPE